MRRMIALSFVVVFGIALLLQQGYLIPTRASFMEEIPSMFYTAV